MADKHVLILHLENKEVRRDGAEISFSVASSVNLAVNLVKA